MPEGENTGQGPGQREEQEDGMHIVAVDTFVLRHALDAPFGFSQGWYDARTAMLVHVTADDGTIGWGEA